VRDRRLDFWRGLCLIDMILVHLVHEGIQFGPFGPVIVDYTRFAAGGFVFVAGLGVGLMFLRDAGPGSPAPFLWRRATYLLGVHYALTGATVAVALLRGLRPPADDAFALVRDIALLREMPSYIDVLPLYVAMLAASPLLLALLRRGHWLLVVLASAACFAWGRHDARALSPAGSVEFPFLLWQAFFVAGLVATPLVPHLDRRRAWRRAMTAAWSGFAVLTLLAYGARFGVGPNLEASAFGKVPLTAAEWLRYLATTLAVVTTSAVLWARLARTAAARVVAQLGRRSLAVYGAHVFVQMLVVAAATPLWWMGGVQGLVVVVPMLAVLWVVARGLDAWTGVGTPLPDVRRVLRGWAAPPAGICAAALLLALAGPLAVRDDATIGPVADVDEIVTEMDEPVHELDFVDEIGEPLFTSEDEASIAL
jgi:hypothetical protein